MRNKLDKQNSVNNKKKTKEAMEPELVKELQKSTDLINSLIHEYLLRKDYIRSLDTFQDEINEKIKIKKYQSTKFSEINLSEQLDNFFSSGKKLEFFTIWNRMIPSHIKLKESSIEKVEFFIQIYFAIYPLLPTLVDKKNIKDNHLKELKIRMQEFKIYLERKEVELSKTTEYLAFYALPYVQNPREHPSYKHIFTFEWINGLKDKIKKCIYNFMPNGKYPFLYDLYFSYLKGDKVMKDKISNILNNIENINEEVINASLVSEDVSRVIEDYNRVKKKEEATKLTLLESQKKWSNFSIEILNIANDLMRMVVPQSDEDKEYVSNVNKKLIKYDNFLKKNLDELEKNTSQIDIDDPTLDKNNSKINNSRLNKTPERSIEEMSQIKSKSIHIDYDPNNLIEFSQIKIDLAKINSFGHDNLEYYNQLNLILREIRLRCSRKRYNKLKSFTLNSIIFYDLFSIRSKHIKIYINLLHNKHTVLETLKLMNVLANENMGRTYLLYKPSIIDELVNIMFKEETDSEIRQNCLGIIQKFTLRTEPQKKLIELDVIKWIVSMFVINMDSLTEYSLEYGLALLMNLSLRSSGRDKCEEVSSKLLKILINFLHSESVQVRTCINGTLYSLLKRKKFKKEAKEMSIEMLLKAQLQKPNDQMKKQIQYILDELNNETESDEKIDEEFEDENYNDEEEELVEDDDYYEEDSINDEMLYLHYQILGNYIIRNDNDNREEIVKINEFIKTSNKQNNKNLVSGVSVRRDELDRPLRRPTTPMTNLSSTSNSQIFTMERKSIASRIRANFPRTESDGKIMIEEEKKIFNENVVDEINQNILTEDIDLSRKRDKIPRTPVHK